MNGDFEFTKLLGKTKDDHSYLYLTGFSWDCEWYWGGGGIETTGMHTHFDVCFLNEPVYLGNFWHPLGGIDIEKISNGCSVWENLSFFVDEPEYTDTEWWRIKDLFKQFYSLRETAEVFQYGGHCLSKGRNPRELDPSMAAEINNHIKDVIIPEIIKVLNHEWILKEINGK